MMGFYNYSKAYWMTLTIKLTVKVSFNIKCIAFVNNANEVTKTKHNVVVKLNKSYITLWLS